MLRALKRQTMHLRQMHLRRHQMVYQEPLLVDLRCHHSVNLIRHWLVESERNSLIDL
jgi:hypothetical protein